MREKLPGMLETLRCLSEKGHLGQQHDTKREVSDRALLSDYGVEWGEGSAKREALCIPMYKAEVQQVLAGMQEVCPWSCTNQKQASKPKKAIVVNDHSQGVATPPHC